MKTVQQHLDDVRFHHEDAIKAAQRLAVATPGTQQYDRRLAAFNSHNLRFTTALDAARLKLGSIV